MCPLMGTMHLMVADAAGRRSVALENSPFTIGRSSENNLQLTDAQVFALIRSGIARSSA